MLSNRYLIHLVRVNDLEQELPSVASMTEVKKMFGRKGNLSPRYTRHYEILHQVGKITKLLSFCSSNVSRFDAREVSRQSSVHPTQRGVRRLW